MSLHIGRSRRARIGFFAASIAAAAIGAVAPGGTAFAAGSAHPHASGGGHTIVEGGTGGEQPMPVETVLAFHASKSGGHFECLALAPEQPTGAHSGDFNTNAMYVTGPVTSLSVHGHTAVLQGTATVTGIGAGQNQPFTLTVIEGGPGTTVVLEVSGLTFHEILLDGKVSVSVS
jgi:hypothetical protein